MATYPYDEIIQDTAEYTLVRTWYNATDHGDRYDAKPGSLLEAEQAAERTRTLIVEQLAAAFATLDGAPTITNLTDARVELWRQRRALRNIIRLLRGEYTTPD